MSKILRANLAFLLPYCIFLLVAGIYLALYSKAEVHLYLNQFRSNFGDVVFVYITYLGEGIAIGLIALFLCFIKIRYALFTAASAGMASLFTFLLKETAFSDRVRPKKFFEGIAELNLVPGVENHLYHSFPSGHTTAAFAVFFSLALIANNHRAKFLFFILALCVGFSRIYLSQHFLEDVYAGSLIGTLTVLILFRFVFDSGKIRRPAWMEKSFLR